MQDVPSGRAFSKALLAARQSLPASVSFAQRSAVTDWIGNGVVGAGSSIVANASSGRGLVQVMTVPLGPLLFTRDNETKRFSARVDLADVAAATYFGLQSHNTWEPLQSLKHGSLIFKDYHGGVDFHAARVLLLRPGADQEGIAHELIHSAQASFVTIAWEDPLEGMILSTIPGGDWIHRYVELGTLSVVWAGLNSKLATWDRPWETEAHSFDIGC